MSQKRGLFIVAAMRIRNLMITRLSWRPLFRGVGQVRLAPNFIYVCASCPRYGTCRHVSAQQSYQVAHTSLGSQTSDKSNYSLDSSTISSDWTKYFHTMRIFLAFGSALYTRFSSTQFGHEIKTFHCEFSFEFHFLMCLLLKEYKSVSVLVYPRDIWESSTNCNEILYCEITFKTVWQL
jgi:hypothetical protein